jgi:hypothetical protein
VLSQSLFSTTPKPVTEKHLRHARRMVQLSAVLLVLSLIAVIAGAVPDWAHLVVFLMWIHVAVIVVAGAGGWTLRRLAPAPAGLVSPRLGELLAPWVLVVAVASAAVAIPNWGQPSPWDLGRTLAGSAVTDHQWHSEGDRYFERINRGPAREITAAEYDRLNERIFGLFARMWTLFSFGSLMVWRFIALRRKDLLDGDTGRTALKAPQVSATAPNLESGENWKSTALIAGIWVAFIGLNVLSLTVGPHQVFCSIPWPPEMGPFLLVMPILVIGIGSFWTKRSPFMSPWVASLVDQRLGVGAANAFIARLKPLLMFSVCALLGSGAFLATCAAGVDAPVDWAIPGFLASIGVALALAHVILKRRGISGV